MDQKIYIIEQRLKYKNYNVANRVSKNDLAQSASSYIHQPYTQEDKLVSNYKQNHYRLRQRKESKPFLNQGVYATSTNNYLATQAGE